MAKAQYQGAAQRKGFAPVNMNNQAPQRILQEASRVAGGMRAKADAILEDRATQSKAMADNYEIERSQEEMNFKISMGNLQQQKAAAIGRINQRAQTNAAIFKGVQDLSASAAKIAKTIDEQNKKKDDEDFKAEQLKQGFWGNLNSENSAAVLEGSAAQVEAQGSVIAAEAAGAATKLETSRAINTFKGLSPTRKQAFVNQKFQLLPGYLEETLSSGREFLDPQTVKTLKAKRLLEMNG